MPSNSILLKINFVSVLFNNLTVSISFNEIGEKLFKGSVKLDKIIYKNIYIVYKCNTFVYNFNFNEKNSKYSKLSLSSRSI